MSAKVTLYVTQYCPFCTRAKSLLEGKGIDYDVIDVTEDETTRSEIQQKTGWMTVPMIFIGEAFIGGCDELYALEDAGKLEDMIRG